jgi:hypothetical protein
MHKRIALELWNDLQEFPYFRGISVCLGSTHLGAYNPEDVEKAAAFLKGWSEALSEVASSGEEDNGGEKGDEEDGGGDEDGDEEG